MSLKALYISLLTLTLLEGIQAQGDNDASVLLPDLASDNTSITLKTLRTISDEVPVALANEVVGGLHTVNYIGELHGVTNKPAAVPVTDQWTPLNSAELQVGMLVFVTKENMYYRYKGAYSSGTGVAYQANDNAALTTVNSNYWVPLSGDDNDWQMVGNDMYSLPTGNVGIGRTAPAYKLDVDGEVRSGRIVQDPALVGQFSTAIGDQSLDNNTSGMYNVALGDQALKTNTSGKFNVALGYVALTANTSGNYNVALGYRALIKNTTGAYNVALGAQSLYNNRGSSNVALGFKSMYKNTTGTYNVALGYQSMYNNTTGGNNMVLGFKGMYKNTTGKNNVALGYQSMYNNITGTNNVALGYYAGPSADNFTNSIAIGYNAIVAGSNKVRIGNGDITEIGGNVGWSNLSDARVKDNVSESVVGLDFVLKLRPVTYQLNPYKADSIQGDATRTHKAANEKISTGFLAQEVEAAALEVGYDFSGVKRPSNDKDLYALEYAAFVVPLVKAMQEQQEIIEQQSQLIKAQGEALEAFKVEMNSMKAYLLLIDEKEGD